jgi:hypothetical protein
MAWRNYRDGDIAIHLTAFVAGLFTFCAAWAVKMLFKFESKKL